VRRIVSVLYFANVFDTALPDHPPFSQRLEREARAYTRSHFRST
jgi:hypothetical protein